jgi:hypothetical protein
MSREKNLNLKFRLIAYLLGSGESNYAGAPRSKLAGYVRASTQNSVKESDNHNLA